MEKPTTVVVNVGANNENEKLTSNRFKNNLKNKIQKYKKNHIKNIIEDDEDDEVVDDDTEDDNNDGSRDDDDDDNDNGNDDNDDEDDAEDNVENSDTDNISNLKNKKLKNRNKQVQKDFNKLKKKNGKPKVKSNVRLDKKIKSLPGGFAILENTRSNSVAEKPIKSTKQKQRSQKYNKNNKNEESAISTLRPLLVETPSSSSPTALSVRKQNADELLKKYYTQNLNNERKFYNDKTIINRKKNLDCLLKEATYYARSYLNEIFGTMICLSRYSTNVYEHIPNVVNAILRFNNIHFREIILKTYQNATLPEPIWFSINIEDNALYLFADVSLYIYYLKINRSYDVTFTPKPLHIERYNPIFNSQSSKTEIDIAKYKCFMACDHVAQHIIHRYQSILHQSKIREKKQKLNLYAPSNKIRRCTPLNKYNNDNNDDADDNGDDDGIDNYNDINDDQDLLDFADRNYSLTAEGLHARWLAYPSFTFSALFNLTLIIDNPISINDSKFNNPYTSTHSPRIPIPNFGANRTLSDSIINTANQMKSMLSSNSLYV